MEWNSSANDFVEALASSNPTPGGGAGAAMTGAMGCALALMAIETTLKQKSVPPQIQSLLTDHCKRLRTLKTELKAYIQKDADAYHAYLSAKKLPKEDLNRPHVLQEALWLAASVPADTATAALQGLLETNKIEDNIAPVIQSDVLCAQHLLKAAIRCAVENMRANLVYITSEERRKKLEEKIVSLLESC